MTLEELKIVISAQTEPLRKEIEKVGKQLGGLQNETNKVTTGIQSAFKKLLQGVIALQIGRKIGQAIFGGIKEAMNVEAAIQQIKRIMGESSNQFLKWANTQAIAFNMSKGEALKYGSVYGNLVSGFTKSTGETLKYTEDLLKASSIIASSTGRSMTDVMERVRSGLLGNTEAIEDLGVNVNVAMIESTEAFRRFASGRSWKQLDFQTQQQIRLMAILEQTTKKYGDAVNQNTGSQLQQLVAQLRNVQLSLGQAFMPIVQIILPILTSFASGLAYIMGLLAQFSQVLFGKSMVGSSAQVQGTNAQANAMSNLGNATEKAGNKAKKAGDKARGALAGFDEITSLSNNTGGSGDFGIGDIGGTLGGIGGVTPIDFSTNAPEISPKIKELADNVRLWFSSIDFQPLSEAFNRLKTSIEPVVQTIGGIILWLLTDILAPLAKWTIEDALPAFFNLLSGALDVLNPLLESFSKIAIYLWDTFLQPIATWTGGVIVDVLNLLADSLTKIGTWMSENQTVVDAITASIVAFFIAWKVVELLAFIQTSGGVINALMGITKAVWGCTGAKVIDNLETMKSTLLNAKDLVVALGKGTAALASQAIQWTISTAKKVADTVATGAMTAATVAWNIVCGIATAVTTAFGAAVAFLTSPIGIVILIIGSLIAVGVLLYKNWDTVKEVAFRVFGGIKDFIGNACDSIGNFFKGMVNGVIRGMNSLIRGLNKLQVPEIEVPLVGKVGGWGFNIPQIPMLAQGGYIGANSPVLTMIGDNKNEGEIVAPESKLYEQTFKAVVDAMGTSGRNTPIELTINFGSTTIFRQIIDGINKAQRQAGKTLIEV